MTALNIKNSADIELKEIVNVAQNNTLDTLRTDVLASFNQFEDLFNHLKQQVHDQIREEERSYVQDSYKKYEEARSHRYQWFNKVLPDVLPPHLLDLPDIREKNIQIHVDYILNNRLPLTSDAQNLILHRIKRFSGWENTTMVLHPGNEPWLEHMVSNDPLYLVDESYELLHPTMSQFNPMYQSRLRTYIIHEDQDEEILQQLPNNQFGLVLSWNYFNHRPFEVIRRYLTELYEKMRPGGTLLMTYNDCDRWQGVKAVEACIALYTPGSLIKSFAESLGFIQTFDYHDNSSWTWIEFQKPGERQSLRGGQPLAKILPKPVA